ncbi:MAG: metallophosphoesterase family protein [Rikenellaceae bacterium]
MMKKFATLLLAMFILVNSYAQKLKFNNDGKFKIVQLTDIHYGYGTEPSEQSKKDICELLEIEKPDLVVITGDVVYHAPATEGWNDVLSIFENRSIPYAITFGNHDDEVGISRKDVATMLEGRKGSLFIAKTKGVSGYGNYTIPIYDKTGKQIKNIIYNFDSNKYSQIKSVKGYDHIKPDQVAWYNAQSARYKQLHGGIAIPSVAFFHIPLPEYTEAYNTSSQRSGTKGEPECSPKINTGLFSNMLINGDVYAIAVGHDHNNDYTATLHGITLCYGRFAGNGSVYGYLKNGARVFILDEGQKSFETYITTGGEKLYDMSIK